MSSVPDSAPVNELHDALAHSEANRARAVEEAVEHGAQHLREREAQRAARAAATRATIDTNPARG